MEHHYRWQLSSQREATRTCARINITVDTWIGSLKIYIWKAFPCICVTFLWSYLDNLPPTTVYCERKDTSTICWKCMLSRRESVNQREEDCCLQSMPFMWNVQSGCLNPNETSLYLEDLNSATNPSQIKLMADAKLMRFIFPCFLSLAYSGTERQNLHAECGIIISSESAKGEKQLCCSHM